MNVGKIIEKQNAKQAYFALTSEFSQSYTCFVAIYFQSRESELINNAKIFL